jgi:hypothetical protein
MKGSRTVVMPSEMSGEPILRPYSANSKYSQTHTGSPTFDAQTSQSVQSRMKDIDADMRGVDDVAVNFLYLFFFLALNDIFQFFIDT